MAPLIEKLEFGDAIDDSEFVSKATELNKKLLALRSHVNVLEGVDLEELTTEQRVTLRLYEMYSISALCWMQLRLRGQDPNTHPVKQQLQRVQLLMKQKNDILARRNRPVLDKDVAKRFIRSGLWDPKAMEQGPVNKKIKFSDDD